MKKLIVPLLILSCALVLLFVIQHRWDWWKGDASHQTTNDAYVVSNQIPLSTRITGTVRRVAVDDYQSVKAGQVILEIDDTDYKATVGEADAAIAAARAQLLENQSTKRAADASIENSKSGIAQAKAAADSASAVVEAQLAQVTQTSSEYARQVKLLEARAATHQQFEQAQEARDASQATLIAKRADFQRLQDQVASSRTGLTSAEQQRQRLNAGDETLKAQIDAKTAAAAVAKVNLGYTKIYAPADGQISRLQAHPGQLVSAGMQVVDFVQNKPWVEANFQETQLTRIRVGNPADITIDAYPGRKLRAHVSDLAPASGSATALLPPDNASGNFTKVIQRVPVKLRFDNDVDATLLRPGLSAHVTIYPDRTETQPKPATAADMEK